MTPQSSFRITALQHSYQQVNAKQRRYKPQGHFAFAMSQLRIQQVAVAGEAQCCEDVVTPSKRKRHGNLVASFRAS